jgi:putative ABC transport system permease protein
VLRIAAKSVTGNLGRLALTLLAVVLSVSFVAGTFALTDSIDAAFDELFETVTVGVDVYVNPVSEFGEFEGGPPTVDGTSQATLPEDLLEDVRAVAGVASAEGLVQGVIQLIGADGEPIGGFGPPTLGLSWAGEDGAITIAEGAPPVADDEVVLDRATAEEQGFELGDDIQVVVPAVGSQTFTLVGTSRFGEEDSLLGASTASFTLPRAQELFDREGRVDQIVVAAEDGADEAALLDRIDEAVGSDTVEVVSVDEQLRSQADAIDEGLAFLDIALLSFAGVALFVGAFLIVNTFAIVVAQRMREFALLRAVGASAGQLRRQVVFEAGLVGLLGGTLGVLGGIGLSEGLQAVLGAFDVPFPDGGIVLRPRVFVASYLVSMVVTLGAALLPAVRAARVAPVEALRGTGGAADGRPGRTRTALGVVFGVAGTIATLLGLFADTPEPAAVVGGGVAGMFVGVALLAPWVAPSVVTSLGRLLGDSVAARLARRNAARNPTRTSTTASALMIGVALVSFISIVAASINASVAALLDDVVRADLVLSAQGGFGTLPRTLATDLEAVDGVESVAEERLAVARLSVGDAAGEDAGQEAGRQVFVSGIEAAVWDDHADIGASPGALEALLEPGTVLVAASDVEDGAVAIGDELLLDLPAESDVALEVVGTYDGPTVDGDYVIDLGTYEEIVGPGANASISVVFDDGVDDEVVRAGVEDVAAAYPGTDVQDISELVQNVEDSIDGLLNILIGLLVLAIIIAVIGIVNTLVLSVIERTREIGLLRAVGMTRDQVRGTVRREAVLVAVFGALLGIVMGVFFGWALVTALASQGIEVLVIPVPRLLVYVAVAAVAGVVAAVLPARRAARLDILQAVTTE